MATEDLSTNWATAILDYHAKRAASDAAGSNDELTNIYCTAMDHLIDNVPAPTLAAVGIKMDLTLERYEGHLMQEDAYEGIRADVARLVAEEEARDRSGQSPILSLHTRYEAAFAEYNAVDAADSALDPKQDFDRSLSFRFAAAREANTAETDALRRAILYQVPDTWVEAMVLLYHINCAHDLVENTTSQVPGDQEALSVAIETLFDFMAGEVEQDHAELGKQFQAGALLVFERRRFRTGVMDGYD